MQELFDAEVDLIAGGGGVFEISIGEQEIKRLVFSKKELGRFPTDEELQSLIQK